MADEELKIVIGADTSDAEAGLDRAGSALGRIGEIAAGIGLEKVAEKVVDFAKDLTIGSIEAYQVSERALAQLDAVLASTGNTSGMTRDQLVELSRSMENLTSFSDEEVLSVETLLLQYNKLGKETLPEATQAVLDISTRIGVNATTAARMLGKALEDPAGALNSLSRYGIKFTKDQQEMVKGMVAAGDAAQAQKYILDALTKAVGGSAEAMAKTSSGQMEQFKEKVDDIKESIGKVMVNALMPFIGHLNSLTSLFRDLAEGTKKWSDVVDALKNKFPLLGTAITTIETISKRVTDTVLKFWNDHKAKLLPIIEGITKSLSELFVALIPIIQGLAVIIGAVLTFIVQNWQMNWNNILLILSGILEMVLGIIKLTLDLITAALTIFTDIFTGNWTKLWTDVKAVFAKIIDDIKVILQGFFDWASGIINGILNTINQIGTAVKGFVTGKKATGGFAEGLTLVGEEGPELINLPSGSYVNNNTSSNRMVNNSPSINISIYGPTFRDDNDISKLVSQIKKSLGRENELARLGAI
jgi:phage-related protein